MIERNVKSVAKHDGCEGFTLVELSIVILITGLMFIPLVRGYEIYHMGKRISDTRDAVSMADTLLNKFKPNEGNYPCPSDAGLPRTDANYGVSQCAAAAGLLNSGDCTVGGGLCLIDGTRDADGDGDVDRILIGGIPVTTIRGSLDGFLTFSNDDVVDAWGNQIMYGVSETLTDRSSYRYYNGVIGAIDENGNKTAGMDDDAHYVIFSPGRDRRGGFSAEGVALDACNTAVNSKDFENCDGDAQFLQARGYYLNTVGNNYFDDDIYFGKEINQDIWIYEQDLSNIRTKISGNVGVGTDTPTTKLDVQDPGGTSEIRADNSVFAKSICLKSDPSQCFDIDVITGSGAIKCSSSSEVMSGISNADEQCVEPVYGNPTPSFSCPAGQWLNGFRTDGTVICL